MAKLKDDPITAEDMLEFVNTTSDFAFEMRVLECLERLHFSCRHAGTYRDPATQKVRQFDIRALRIADNFKLSLAVECKNFRRHFPLLISTVPRRSNEAFHSLIVFEPTPTNSKLDVKTGKWLYRRGDLVGKQSDQVGRNNNGSIIGNDGETFEKLTQAVNSAHDLIEESATTMSPFVRVVLPMLVIPDGSLWCVNYSENGEMTAAPHQVPQCSFYIGQTHSFVAGHQATRISYTMTHIEFVTFGFLEELIKMYFTQRHLFDVS